MYAIINFTKQTTQFYATEEEAHVACVNYAVREDIVVVVDLQLKAVEQL
jgi:hypothetical protein